MAAEENLSPDQFAKKKRWVPDQLGHLASWHVLKWHVNGNGSVGRKEAHDIHMRCMQRVSLPMAWSTSTSPLSANICYAL